MKNVRMLVGIVLFAGLAVAQTPKEYLYSVHSSGQISAFSIDLKKGTFHNIPGSPFRSAGSNLLAAMAPGGSFLYVCEISNRETFLRIFRIDPGTGALTETSASPFQTKPHVMSIAIDETGRFLYYISHYKTINAFTIDANLGALTPIGPPISANGASQVLADPAGPYLFSDATDVYHIDPNTGALTLAGGASFGGTLALNPSGSRLFAGSSGIMNVLSFDPASGTLTPIAGSPFPSALKTAIALDPSGRFLYGLEKHAIGGYLLDAATGGLLTKLGAWSLPGIGTLSLAIEPSGKFLYAGESDKTIAAYAINRTGGLLTLVAGAPFKARGTPMNLFAVAPSTAPPPSLVSIQIAPPNPMIDSSAPNHKIQFTAVGQYADGSTRFLTASAAWSSSNTAFATIQNAPGSAGLAAATGIGSTTITAQIGSLTATATLTVNSPSLASIAVTPADPTLNAGTAIRFTAIGTYTDGSTQNLTKTAAWSSSTPAVAKINAAGRAVTLTPGTTTIAATAGSVTGSTLLTVQ